MASGFSAGGGPDFYTVGNGINNGRSAPMMSTNNTNSPQLPYRSTLAGIIPDPASQMIHRGSDLIGKRSLAEFQQQQHQLIQQHQQFQQRQQQQQQQQMVGLSALYSNLRNVKPRVNYGSPISPLSPVDLSSAVSSLSPELTSISNSSLPMNSRFGLANLQQQLRQQQQQHLQQRMNNLAANSLANGNILFGTPNRFSSANISSSLSYPNLVQNHPPAPAGMPTTTMGLGGQQSFSPAEDQTKTENMLNRLHELEKQLLDDDDNCSGTGSGEAVSVVTNSEWSDTINNLNLITTNGNENKAAISRSPTSSSSSCSSTSASPPIIRCPRQSISEIATAISECRMEAAGEGLTRLAQVSNFKGTSQQRLTAYMASALRSRVNPTEYPPPVSELYSKDHTLSTHMLYEVSPCFKLGFMAANLAILEAVSESAQLKLHVIDFDIGQGGQYLHLLHALAAKKVADKPAVLKITTFVDSGNGEENRLKAVGDSLTVLANKLGVALCFNVMSLKINELSREKIGVESDEPLAVNFAFNLYKLPDESVTTDNLRDELLRRVKGLSPKVVTLVEQEMNANTAAFASRVNEACGFYGVLFDSLDATVPRDSSERVRIEEGLGRKMANSVACEGRDRIERCEVFGKWRARMSMAGFEPKMMSQLVADTLVSRLNSGPRGNPGFTVNEHSGGICFGWMGRTLTVASAWR